MVNKDYHSITNNIVTIFCTVGMAGYLKGHISRELLRVYEFLFSCVLCYEFITPIGSLSLFIY